MKILNIYACVGGNRVNFIDPKGENIVVIGGVVVTIISASYKVYKFCEAYSDAKDKLKAANENSNRDFDILKQAENGGKIPSDYDPNATNQSVEDFSKAAAEAAVKGGQLPGTAGGGSFPKPVVPPIG